MPPPLEAIAKITSIEGVRITPTVLTTQQGPDRHLGPEAAGALLILQGTFRPMSNVPPHSGPRLPSSLSGCHTHPDLSAASVSLMVHTAI
jgi:hypothetical protein